jgi:hypothetical protein
MPTSPDVTYRPLGALSYVTATCFIFVALMSLYLGILGLAYVVFHHDPFSPDESGALATVFILMSFVLRLEPLFVICGIVTLLIWMYRAYRNLGPLLARNLDYSAGWAIGAWFIPLVNFVLPFIIMREIWNGSDPKIEENNKFTRDQACTPDILVTWWLSFLISNVGGRISDMLSVAENADAKAMFPGILMASQLLRATAAVMLIMTIREIAKRQSARYRWRMTRRVSEAPPLPPQFGESFAETVLQGSMPDQQKRQHEQPHAGHEVPVEANNSRRGE